MSAIGDSSHSGFAIFGQFQLFKSLFKSQSNLLFLFSKSGDLNHTNSLLKLC